MDSGDLFIAGLIVFLIVTVIFAAQKRYVVYFDGTDLLISVLTWLFLPVTFFFARFFGLSETFTTILLVIACIGTVICFFTSFVMCCHYNKSILAGLFVGLFKILFAVFGILLFIGLLISVPDNKKNTESSGCVFLLFLIAFGLFGYLARCMINGPAVYLNNQWTFSNDAAETKNENSNDNDGDDDDDADSDDDDDSDDDLDWAYEILGISEDASDEEVKQAYTKQVKESHPDKLPANTPEWIIKVAQEKFAKLQEAYKAICEARK